MRDHDTVVEKPYHRQVWKTVGDPGALLVDGEVAGTWRPRKSGRTLTITITTFDPLRARHRRQIDDEAHRVAALRGATTAVVAFATN